MRKFPTVQRLVVETHLVPPRTEERHICTVDMMLLALTKM